MTNEKELNFIIGWDKDGIPREWTFGYDRSGNKFLRYKGLAKDFQKRNNYSPEVKDCFLQNTSFSFPSSGESFRRLELNTWDFLGIEECGE